MSKPLDYSNSDPSKYKRQKRRSKQQEQRIAKDINGKRSSTSGAVRGMDGYSVSGTSGDVTSKNFKIEAKYTDKKSYRIDEGTIMKIMLEAESDDLDWVLQVDVNGFESSGCHKSFALIEWDTFVRLANASDND